jgi:hypothetical protein
MVSVSIHKAVVKNGRLVLDEPTDLPEGEVVELQDVDPYTHLDNCDELDDAEREQLHEAISQGLDEIDAGKGIPGEDFLKELDSL